MTDGVKGKLRFSFQELSREIQALQTLAVDFVDVRSTRALAHLSEQLDGLWDAEEGRTFRWQLQDLWTIESEGEYEPGDRRGSKHIVASISGVWEVQPLGGTSRKERSRRFLEFCGIASTRVRIYEASDQANPIAMWRMELGDANSPGCFFHVQVLGESDANPFPKSVSVPRLPSLFVLPTGAVEYVLGELFQDRWAQAAMENSGPVQQWTAIQKRRLSCLLDWQSRTVRDSLTSPWIALKRAKPASALFNV